ncbi:MAG: cytochrome b/b6 domain-containing protein [Hyphomicrobiales bacterium]
MTTLPVDSLDTSSARRYTTVAIVLHWAIAIAILFQLVGGKWMVSAGAAATGSVFTVFQIHKTVGLTILALTLARIIWRLANPAPALPDGMNRLERFAASVTHLGFYAFLIAVPLSGWAMASVSPTGVPTFFLLLDILPFAHLPLLADAGLTERHTAEAFLKSVHYYLALAMGLLIVLHVAAALKHQFIAKDNLIARMIISARSTPNSIAKASVGGIAAAAALMFLVGGIAWGIGQSTSYRPATAADASGEADLSSTPDAWVIDQAASSLGFTITYTGSDIAGTIGSWTGNILFDPINLESASATITIDMTSVSLNDATLQAQASGGDGFDLANHATATYQANQFARADDGRYLADGTLTLRGVSFDVPLSFAFEETDGVASVVGSASVNRLDFGIGAVGAANEAWLLYQVDIAFDLTATRP